MFMFAEKEAMFSTNARMPFPASASAWLREGSREVSGAREVEERRKEGERDILREDSSPERVEYRRPWMNANGDMRKRISSGERARGPVIMRFETTV